MYGQHCISGSKSLTLIHIHTQRALVSSPRKIVFNMPSLLPDAGRSRAADPAAQDAASAPGAGPDEVGVEGGEDARKLAMLVEVSQALTGTLNLQAGFYGRPCTRDGWPLRW